MKKPIVNLNRPSDTEQVLRNDGLLAENDIVSEVVMDFMEKLQSAQSENGNFNYSRFYANYKKEKIQNRNVTKRFVQQPLPMQLTPIPEYSNLSPNYNPYCYSSSSNKKDGRPMTAYRAAQKLMRMVSFLAIDEALYAFNGTFYELQTETSARRTILHHCRELVNQVGTVEIIKQILELVKIEPAISWKELKPSNRFVVFKNSILDLQAMQMVPLTPKIFDTSCLVIDCVANAPLVSPNFDQFLLEITGGNELLIRRIWQVIGYLITNDTDGKSFFVMQGVSNSGKSLLGRFIASLYNSDAVTSLDINSFGERFSMAEIVGKKLNISLDLPHGVIKNDAVSNIKQLTGGDLITTDVKYMSRIKFLNTCRLLYATNHAIRLGSPDEAFENRMVVIPFGISISPEHRDPHLLEKFEPEKLAIVMKALLAYQELVANNYQFAGHFPPNQVVGSEHYQSSPIDVSTLVQAFIQQCCDFTDCEYGTFTEVLFNAFRRFVGSSDAISVKEFSMFLQEICGTRIRKDRWRVAEYGSNPRWGYRGIKLK